MKIFNHDNALVLRDAPDAETIDHVPGGVYLLKFDLEKGMIILGKECPRFEMPTTVLGTTTTRAEHIAKVFHTRTTPTGVILEGVKGSGKTLLARAICNRLIDGDIPVIKVEDTTPPSILRAVIKMCSGHCCFLFDEFEKTHDSSDQEHLIGFFSDADNGKVMNIITTNDVTELNDAMINRPGRFLFNLSFAGIEDVVLDQLIVKAKLSTQLVDMMRAYSEAITLTYDIAETIVNIVKDCQTIDEAANLLSLYNVPAPPLKVYELEGMTINKIPVDPSIINVDVLENGNITISTFSLENPEYNGEYTFTIEDPEYLVGKRPRGNFMIHVLDFGNGTVVRIDTRWIPRAGEKGLYKCVKGNELTTAFVKYHDVLAEAEKDGGEIEAVEGLCLTSVVKKPPSLGRGQGPHIKTDELLNRWEIEMTGANPVEANRRQ